MGIRSFTPGNFGNALLYSVAQDRVWINNKLAGYDDITTKDSDLKLKSSTSQYYLAQGFKISSSKKVTTVGLYIKRNGSPSGNIWVEIQGDSSGNPDNSAVATSSSVDVSVVPTSKFMFYKFEFSTPPTLTGNTQYHLVLKGDYTTSDTDNITWGSDNSSPSYSDGNASKSDNSGTPVWTADANRDMLFRIKNALDINDDLSVEARICMVGGESTERVIFTLESVYKFYINTNNQLVFSIYDEVGANWSNVTDDNTKLSHGVSYHVAATFDESQSKVKIYVNGSHTKEGTISVKLINLIASGWIGNVYAWDKTFFGSIDEVRISKVVRTYTPSSIKIPYVKDNDTIALWHLDDNASTVVDSSDNEMDGILYGTGSGPTFVSEYGIIAAINDSAETTKIQSDAIGSSQITGLKIASSVAGDGLQKDGSGNLEVKVDNSTIEINSDTVRVKDSGIISGKINDSAVVTAKINDEAVTEAKIANILKALLKDRYNTRNLEWLGNSVLKIKATSDTPAKFLASGFYGGKDVGYILAGSNGKVMENTVDKTMILKTSLWHLDETGTPSTSSDEAGLNTLTNYGSRSFTTGKFNNAWSGNHTDAYLTKNNPVGLATGRAPFTIEGWIYLDDITPASDHLYSFWSYGDDNSTGNVWVGLYNNGSSVELRFGITGGTQKIVSNPFSATTWYHVALVWDGSNIHCYVDGENKGSESLSSLNISTTPGSFRIGNYSGGNANWVMKGRIDEVRFSNFAS